MIAGIALIGGAARADGRPPVALELAACLDGERDAIQRAVRIELGEAAGDGAVTVRIDCAPDGVDAGVVLEVRPGGPRRYRYALDWRTQPLDARPRLLGLAVAEAVDASRIELVAVPEPAVVAPAVVAPVAAPPAWSLAVAVGRRGFSARRGVALVGLGVAAGRRLTPHLRAIAELTAEGETALASSGAVTVRALSVAPRLAYRAGGRVHAELGAGVRLGVATLAGEALPNTRLVGSRATRGWLGPTASLAIGVELTPRLELAAGLELGTTVGGATVRDFGEPVAALGGHWLAVGLGAAVAL